MSFLRTLTPIGWAIAAALAAVIVAAVLWFAGGSARREAAVAQAQTQIATSRTVSAAQAGATLDQAHASATASETLSRETADAIRQAPGADVRLDPALNRAARERLCHRAAYAGRPECVQLSGGAKPSR